MKEDVHKEVWWMQKSGIKWLKEGDKSTWFFHVKVLYFCFVLPKNKSYSFYCKSAIVLCSVDKVNRLTLDEINFYHS